MTTEKNSHATKTDSFGKPSRVADDDPLHITG